MATLTHLPDEVIATILENKNISMEDILNLKYTCKRLQRITFSTKFWEKKFCQRFPLSKRIHNKKRLKEIVKHLGAGLKCIEKLWHYVSLMSYSIQDIKEMELNGFLRSIVEHSTIYRFVLDDINRILSQLLCQDLNLTVKYYFDLIYHWLKQYRLAYKQIKFINMPREKQLLEKQITIIAQYLQPDVSYSFIDAWLDNIVQKVLSRLENKYPRHSIFSTSSEQFNLWRNNNINDDFWIDIEVKQIMCTIKQIIFSKFGNHQLHELLATLEDEECMYYILFYERSLLPIIYTIVSRRLGVCCFLSYKTNFRMAIIWKLNDSIENRQLTQHFYRKPRRRYSWRTERIIDSIKYPFHMLYNLSEIRRMISDIYNLIYYFSVPHLMQVSYEWKIMYMLNLLLRSLGDNIGDIDRDNEYTYITRSIKKSDNGWNIVIYEEPKIKKNDIKFTIGMIVRHSSIQPWFPCNSIYHTGVIIGWHHKCEAVFVYDNLNLLVPQLSEYYVKKHILNSCRYHISIKSKCIRQPHYIILTNNNKICYVPQSKIRRSPPTWINNVEIGRYFTRFEGNYYVPNDNLARNYPDDMAVMHKIFSN